MIYKKSNVTKSFLAQQQNKYISVTENLWRWWKNGCKIVR